MIYNKTYYALCIKYHCQEQLHVVGLIQDPDHRTTFKRLAMIWLRHGEHVAPDGGGDGCREEEAVSCAEGRVGVQGDGGACWRVSVYLLLDVSFMTVCCCRERADGGCERV